MLKAIAGAPDRPLTIGNVEIQCYVLEDETRVLSQRGLQSGLGMSEGGGKRGARRIASLLGHFGRKGSDIKDLTARANSPIEFQPPSGGRTVYGYPAKILVELCEAIHALIELCRAKNRHNDPSAAG